MDKVRIGVIGTGGMGQGHCKIWQELEESELTCICDINEATREAVASEYDVPGFAEYEELLDSGLVDAVSIATPHYDHPPIGIAAMKRGFHVLSEKPIAVTVKAADEFIAAANETGVKFAVMFQRRSQTRYRKARKAIDEGLIGEIYRTNMVGGWYRSQAYYNSGGWRATWKGEGGGVLLNQAPHNLDTFTWLGGKPAKVTATCRTLIHDIEVEDEAFAVLEYANGAHGYIYLSTTEAPGVERTEICGDRGKIVIDGGRISIRTLDTPIKQFTVENESMWASPKAEEVEIEVEELSGDHRAIGQNFLDAILREAPLLAPGQDAAGGLELANAMILSSRRNKTVELPIDRDEYEELIRELQASSREKATVSETIQTDPNIR